MPPESPHDILRKLDQLTDTQLSAISLRTGDTRIQSTSDVAVRYVGGVRQPAGLPYGLAKDEAGKLKFKHIAVVRIQPQDHIFTAKRIVFKSTRRSIFIASGCGILAAVMSLVGWAAWQNRMLSNRPIVTPPCLVSAISSQAVICRQGDRMVSVVKGKFFPDGRYRLDAILPGQTGFSATLIGDRRNIVFQVDPNFSTTKME